MSGIEPLEDFERRAANEGCEAHWNDYPSCVGDESARRRGGVVDDGCAPEFTRLLRCLG
jgi:hypothetical protein